MSLPLAKLLVEQGAVVPAAMDDALQRQAIFGGSLDTNLLEVGACDEETLTRALGVVHQLPVADLNRLEERDPRIDRLIPPRLAQKYGVVPLALSGRNLTVLTSARLHPLVLEEISFMLSLALRCQVVCEARLHWLMHAWLGVEMEPRYQVLAERLGSLRPAKADAPSPEALAAREALGSRAPHPEPDADRVQQALGRIEKAEMEEERQRELARRGRLDLVGALKAILEAKSREDLVNVLLRFARQQFEFVGLFVINNQTILGWDAVGSEGARERIRRIRIPLSVPSVLQTVARTGARFLGPIPLSGINDELLSGLGRARPRNALILPLSVRDRVIGLLYGDSGERAVRGVRLTDLWVLAGRLPEAFERLIRRQKAIEPAAAFVAGALRAAVESPPPAPIPPEPAPFDTAGDGRDAPSGWVALSPAQPPAIEPPAILPPEEETRVLPPEPDLAFPVVGPAEEPPQGVLPMMPESAEPGPDETAPQPVAETATESPMPSEPPGLAAEPKPQSAATAEPASGVAEPAGTLVQGLAAEPPRPPAPAGEVVSSEGETPLQPEPSVPRPEEIAPAVEVASLDMPVAPRRPVESSVRIDEDLAAGEQPVRVQDGDDAVVVLDSATALAPALPPLPQPVAAEAPAPAPAVSAAVTEPDPDMLVDRWLAADRFERGELEQRLRALGPAALAALVRRFPGPLMFDVRGCHDSIPPLSEHGELLRLMLEFGPAAAEAAAQRLEDPDARVRYYAVKLVEELPSGPLVPRLSRRLYDREPFVRLAAIDALQACRKTPQFAQLLADLRARLQDADPDRRAVAAALLGNFRDRMALPGLIALLDHPSRIVARAAVESLAYITKQDMGPNKRKWLKWWKTHKDGNRFLWLIDGLRSKNRDIRFSSAREIGQLTQEYFGYFFDSEPAEREKAVRRIETWWQEKGRHMRFE